MAREEQFRFLQAGLQLNPGASYGQALASTANKASARALAAEEASGKATGAAVTAVGTALSDYLDKG